jgi:hypothetical protein
VPIFTTNLDLTALKQMDFNLSGADILDLDMHESLPEDL